MIRPANGLDIGAIVLMAQELARVTGQPLPVESGPAGAFVAALVASPDAFVRVVDIDGRIAGFIAATVSASPLLSGNMAVEHGWYCNAPGWGAKLLAAYLAWAKEKGCRAARLSTADNPGRVGEMVAGHGFHPCETAWVKVL